MKFKNIVSEKYKYELEKEEIFLIPEPKIFKKINSKNFYYDKNLNLLRIFKGYRWDGASGPTIDTENFMQGSLIHDCLYQLIREKYIDKSYRKVADKILRNVCGKNGMSFFRRNYVYFSVKFFGWWFL